jgi:integrase
VDDTPIHDVSKPRTEEKAKAFLRPEDVKQLLKTIDSYRDDREGKPGPTPDDHWLKQMVRVAVGTGLRRGELLIVRNRDDFTAKSGNERTVPIRGDALGALQEMQEHRSPSADEPVFVDANGDVPKPTRVSKRFKFYVRQADIPNHEDLSFHSCRHTTGSWLSMQGVPLRVISEILGHSSTQVTEMYSHLRPEVLERAMDEAFGQDENS